MKNTFKILLTSCLTLGLFACVEKKPEGPAEMIGKGIDQMAEGFKKIDQDNRYGKQDPRSPDYRAPERSRDDYTDRGRYDKDSFDRSDDRNLDRPDPYYDDSARDEQSEYNRRRRN